MCSADKTTQTGGLEARLHSAYWGDGALDLCIGLGVLAIGTGWLLGAVVSAAAVPAVMIPVWMALRKRVVEPRLGRVVFDEKRRSRTRSGLTSLLVVGTAALLCGIAGYMMATGQGNRSLMPLLVTAFPASLMGLAGILSGTLFGICRLSTYGVVAIAIGVGMALLSLEPGWSLLASGAMPFLTGGYLMTTFLRNYPRLSNELE